MATATRFVAVGDSTIVDIKGGLRRARNTVFLARLFNF